MSNLKLLVKRFAQIDEAAVEFSDLTVLVGPQATGKSLLLQFLKFGLDRPVVANSFRKKGYPWPRHRSGLAATFLGEGYEKCFSPESVVKLGSKDVLTEKGRTNAREPIAFFVPAQRVVSIHNGWPKAFSEYGPGDPFVVREFSQNIFESFGRGLGREGAPIFPQEDRFKSAIRKSIEDSIFHRGKLVLRQDGARKQLAIRYPARPAAGTEVPQDTVSLPFLEWSAGQREFTPLLLGLQQLITGGKVTKHPYYDWAIIEEPEMGLHPQAINAVMLLVFELLSRNYRVAISTHSPYVLELIWAIQSIKRSRSNQKIQLLLDAMNSKDAGLKPVAAELLKKKIRVYALNLSGEGRHSCRDISSLNPSDENQDIAGWGGVVALSAKITRAVARASRH